MFHHDQGSSLRKCPARFSSKRLKYHRAESSFAMTGEQLELHEEAIRQIDLRMTNCAF